MHLAQHSDPDSLGRMLRPVVDDAAQSIAYGDGQLEHAEIMAWFDRLTVEDMQEMFMGAVQDVILAHMQKGNNGQ